MKFENSKIWKIGKAFFQKLEYSKNWKLFKWMDPKKTVFPRKIFNILLCSIWSSWYYCSDSRGPVLLASLPTTPLPPTASLLRQAGATSAALDLSSPPFSGGATRLSPPPAVPTQLPQPGVGHPLLHAPGPEPQDAVGGGQPSLNASSNPAGISRQQLINRCWWWPQK